MSERVGDLTSLENGGTPTLQDTVIDKCVRLVSQYRDGDKTKAQAVLALHEVLDGSSSEREFFAQGNTLTEGAFATYSGMLDQVDSERVKAKRRGKTVAIRRSPSGDGDRDSGIGSSKSPGERVSGIRTRPASEYEIGQEARTLKKRRTGVDESLFPWGPSAEIVKSTSPTDQQRVLTLLDNWANDPVLVVRKILLSPGCPDFPPDQWLRIIKGLAVDLSRVLGAHYSAEVDQTKPIRTHGEWFIAFGKTLQATSYVLPPQRDEYVAWESYISRLFASVHPTYHDRVIQFDRAARLRVSHQKHIRLDDVAQFEDLRIMFLSPYGRGSSTGEREGDSSNRGRRKNRESSGQRDPCHKWNRNECPKSASECFYQHCCDKRGCRGNHRRPDCLPPTQI